MFRFLSRVVVVSVVALSLNFSIVPDAQARPQESGRAVPATLSWMEEAMSWVSRILGRELKSSLQSVKRVMANDGGAGSTSGPCIDPHGNPRPCP